jgi:hypothetical protein
MSNSVDEAQGRRAAIVAITWGMIALPGPLQIDLSECTQA